MIIKLTDLVTILHLDEKAPIHYQPPENLNRENYIFFRFMSQQEKTDIENKSWNKNTEYPKEELGIYVPDVTIDEFIDLEKERNYVHEIINLVSYTITVPMDEYNLVFAIFCLLHEVGHWIHFKKMGLTSYDYFQWDKRYRADLVCDGNKIYNMPDNSFEKHILVREYNERYRKIPSEMAADTYALEHINESINIVRKHYGLRSDVGLY